MNYKEYDSTNLPYILAIHDVATSNGFDAEWGRRGLGWVVTVYTDDDEIMLAIMREAKRGVKVAA